jgi:hypothetical protein
MPDRHPHRNVPAKPGSGKPPPLPDSKLERIPGYAWDSPLTSFVTTIQRSDFSIGSRR